MSFHEQSAWACLVSTVLIWGVYFTLVLTRSAEQSRTALLTIVVAIVLQTVVMIGSHMLIAAVDRGDGRHDERDQSIALRSGNWAGWVLSVGVLLCVVFFPVREMALHMDPPGRLA
jgi:choline-glycine betaine transporter